MDVDCREPRDPNVGILENKTVDDFTALALLRPLKLQV